MPEAVAIPPEVQEKGTKVVTDTIQVMVKGIVEAYQTKEFTDLAEEAANEDLVVQGTTTEEPAQEKTSAKETAPVQEQTEPLAQSEETAPEVQMPEVQQPEVSQPAGDDFSFNMTEFGEQFLKTPQVPPSRKFKEPGSVTIMASSLRKVMEDPDSVTKSRPPPQSIPESPQPVPDPTNIPSSSTPVLPEDLLHIPQDLASFQREVRRNQKKLLKGQEALFKSMDMVFQILHQQQSRQQAFENWLMHRLTAPSEPPPANPIPPTAPRPSKSSSSADSNHS